MEIRYYHLDQLALSLSLEDRFKLLNQEEQDSYAQRGERYLLTRSELKLALAQYSNQSAESIQISYNKHGKPYWKDEEDIHFNISHSYNMLAIAIDHHEIGIDLELIRARKLSTKRAIARRIFHAEQYDKLQEEAFADEYFYRYWCATEALVKQQGLSLWSAKTQPVLHLDDKHYLLNEQPLHMELNIMESKYMTAIAHIE